MLIVSVILNLAPIITKIINLTLSFPWTDENLT